MMLRNEVDVFHKRWKEQGPYHNKTVFEFGMMKTTSIPILTKIRGINFGDKVRCGYALVCLESLSTVRGYTLIYIDGVYA